VKFDIPYGQGSVGLELADCTFSEVVSPKRTPVNENSIAKSLSNTTNFKDLDSFLANKRKILVAINDHTRPTPTSIVLKKLDLKGKKVTTIIATGTHRSPNPAELSRILGGAAPPYGGKVVVHDSRDSSQLKLVGRTSRGTKLFLNRKLLGAEGIIVVGSVEPHYFAGFTGGRKFLLPALSGLESIVMNHSYAVDERSKILALDGNPVHEDFMEALNLFDRYDDIFSIQLVLNSEQQVSFASSGHIIQSFMECVERAKDIYAVPVETRADIVISVARPPLDLDLYQSQKAIDNVKLALKDGGVLILVSKCPDGIGDRGFYNILASSRGVPPKANACEFGFHKAAKMAEIFRRARVFAVTDLPPEVLRTISITPYKKLQDAVEDAVKLKGKESKILTVRDAGVTVPFPKTSSGRFV
jgi:nickel-dependent lactate racemase